VEAGDNRLVATNRAGGGPEAGVRRMAATAADNEADGVRYGPEEEVEGVLLCDG
jgi:hypothetical protein